MVRGVVDRFRDQWELVVEGRLAADGEVFAGTRVYSKCVTKYEAPLLESERFR
jgi:cytochrome c-type biogenesis protein CcmE